MAIHPTDYNQEIMRAEHGTVVLATSPIADLYLKKAKASQYNIPENRYSRPCGGAGGFDDFVERWHE